MNEVLEQEYNVLQQLTEQVNRLLDRYIAPQYVLIFHKQILKLEKLVLIQLGIVVYNSSISKTPAEIWQRQQHLNAYLALLQKMQIHHHEALMTL